MLMYVVLLLSFVSTSAPKDYRALLRYIIIIIMIVYYCDMLY